MKANHIRETAFQIVEGLVKRWEAETLPDKVAMAMIRLALMDLPEAEGPKNASPAEQIAASTGDGDVAFWQRMLSEREQIGYHRGRLDATCEHAQQLLKSRSEAQGRPTNPEPEYWEGGWLRQGVLAICPECKQVKEGTASWAIQHERSCQWKPAGTWFAKRLENEIAERERTHADPVQRSVPFRTGWIDRVTSKADKTPRFSLSNDKKVYMTYTLSVGDPGHVWTEQERCEYVQGWGDAEKVIEALMPEDRPHAKDDVTPKMHPGAPARVLAVDVNQRIVRLRLDTTDKEMQRWKSCEETWGHLLFTEKV